MEHWRVNSNCKVICFSCEKVFTLNNRHIFMIMHKEDDNDNHKDNHDNFEGWIIKLSVPSDYKCFYA